MNFTKHRIFFRADGSSKIGLGHVVRCLALIEMLNRDFECIFLIKDADERIMHLIEKNCKLIELRSSDIHKEVLEVLNIVTGNDIVVLDGYCFNSKYQRSVKSKVSKLVMIDDKADQHYYADLIINHGSSSIENKYSKELYTKVLVGFPYTLLRKEFLASAKLNRVITKVDTAFICMGGSDPFNITLKVLKACIQCDFIKTIFVVTGSAYSNADELLSLINEYKSVKKIFREINVDAQRMVELISMSDIAVSPASSVSLEICSVKAGLLSGIVIDNQNTIHEELVHSECCISIGDFNIASENEIISCLEKLKNIETVNSMIRNQSKAIDGLSGERILVEFKELIEC